MFWLILGVILIAAEFMIPEFLIFFFGIGALLTGILASFLPLGFPLEILIFTVSSLGSLFTFRKMFKNIFQGKELLPDNYEHSGETAKVIESVKPGKPGRIMFKGTSWKAVSDVESFKKGEEVTILEENGLEITIGKLLLLDDDGLNSVNKKR
jgi:membrane protein implicated in regulation of membrane protease activity